MDGETEDIFSDVSAEGQQAEQEYHQEEFQQRQPEPQGGEQEQQGQGQQAQSADPNAALMAEMVSQNRQLIETVAQGQQQQQQPQQVDPNQVKKALQFYEMDTDTFSKIFNDELPIEERMAALQGAFDGMSRHAATLSQVSAQRMQQQLDQQFQPALQMAQAQKQEKFASMVEGKFPALKNQRQLIDIAIRSLQQEDYREPDDQKAADAVANRVQELVRASNPNWDVRHGQGQQAQQHQSASGLPNMGSGGTSGSQGAANQQGGSKKPAWQGVFS